MSNCNKISELLSAYIDGEVTIKEKELVENHLLSCTSCKQKLDIMQKTSNILKETPQIPVPETLLKDFEEYRKKAEQTEKKVVPLYKNYRVYASIAAIFIFAFVLKSGLWQEGRFMPDAPDTPTGQELNISGAENLPSENSENQPAVANARNMPVQEEFTNKNARALSEATEVAADNTPAVAEVEADDSAIAAYDETQNATPMTMRMAPPPEAVEEPEVPTHAIVYVAEEHLERAMGLLSEGKYFYSQIEQKLNDNRIPFETNFLSLDESIPHKVVVMVKE